MKTFKQFLTEAKAGNAWNGKIEHIEKLLSWMYDKDILTKAEKAEKDKIFKAYFRYYNDGDFPRALLSKGIDKYSSDEEIGVALEEYLNDFIKRILSKYAGKYSRKEFRYDQLINQINDAISQCDIDDKYFSPSSLTYWVNYIPNKDDELVNLIYKLNTEYDKLDSNMKEIENKSADIIKQKEKNYRNGSICNKVINVAVEEFKKYNLWNNALENQLRKVKSIVLDIENKLRDAQTAARKAHDLGVID